VPIRESVAKLRKRLETDVEERALIAKLKTALAERVYEIQTARAAGVTKSRVAVAAQVRERVISGGSSRMDDRARASRAIG
jgi:hypothetical protein